MAEKAIDADTLRYQAQIPKPDVSGQSQFSQFVGPEIIALAQQALIANAAGKSEVKPPKSGVFTRTYNSNNIPAESSIKDTVNKVFQKYYGRDALETEFQT